MKDTIEEGDEVIQSPVGPGIVTDISAAGYPIVNDVAVAWCVMADGGVFNPRGCGIPEELG